MYVSLSSRLITLFERLRTLYLRGRRMYNGVTFESHSWEKFSEISNNGPFLFCFSLAARNPQARALKQEKDTCCSSFAKARANHFAPLMTHAHVFVALALGIFFSLRIVSVCLGLWNVCVSGITRAGTLL